MTHILKMRVFGNDYPKLHVNKKYAADIASFCVFLGAIFYYLHFIITFASI